MTPFAPTAEWQDVPDGAVLPPGCQIEMDVSTGRQRVRMVEPAQKLSLDLEDARRFLELLDPEADAFTFQTFLDRDLKHRGDFAHVRHGSLDLLSPHLESLQGHGAGVFVTINETDLEGRRTTNVVKVRAVFVDLDGSPLAPVMACELEPHIVTETSPGRWHAYWIVDALPLDQFRDVQKSIIARFNGDKAIHDLPRVMRVPGSWHLKREPFLCRIVHTAPDWVGSYTAEEILAEFPPRPTHRANGAAPNGAAAGEGEVEPLEELVRQVMTAESYHGPLVRLAWRYLADGMGDAKVVETLQGLLFAVPPPHDERWQARFDDLPRAVASAVEKQAAASVHDLSHDALALDMGQAWAGDARHVALWGRWLFWDGSRWQPAEKLEHMTRSREYLRQRAAAIVDVHRDGRSRAAAKKLRAKETVAAVVDLARSNRELVAGTGDWDRDPFLAGAPGATVDLRTGECILPCGDHHITKALAVAPAARGTAAPLWVAFLDRITAGDRELAAYLKRLAGYSLTGDVSEHALAFAYGTGANGKGVFFGTLLDAMGDYGASIGTDMLMVSTTDRHPTEVARLRGVRLAVGSEIENGRTWAESKIKTLTGGDRLQARFMRQDFFEFDPAFTLVVTGNHKPSLRGVDEAIRRRMHLVPFTVTIPAAERDPQLREKLRQEWPAILRWAVDGCLEWQRLGGLMPPASVRAATETYLAGEDVVERWREDCLSADPKGFAPVGSLWLSWRDWAQQAGEFVGTKRKFSDALTEHGLRRGECGKAGTRGFYGVKLKNPIPATAASAKK